MNWKWLQDLDAETRKNQFWKEDIRKCRIWRDWRNNTCVRRMWDNETKRLEKILGDREQGLENMKRIVKEKARKEEEEKEEKSREQEW